MGTDSIRKIVNSINNEEENGGLWLPNIQRYFIWSEDQIERLFDSVMRSYPISSLLFWKTKEKIKSRKFIDIYKDDIQISLSYLPKNEKVKRLVLDGQQRLQSFYIALKGSYNGKELYFNIYSGDKNMEYGKEDTIFEFKFLHNPVNSNGKKFNLIDDKWVNIKDVIFKKWEVTDVTDLASSVVSKTGIKEEQIALISNRIVNNLTKLRVVFIEDNLEYHLLDGIDEPDLYTIDDVVEIFIRVNSGGTELSKSDLMFTLLTAGWEEIEEDLNSFLEEINSNDFNFGRDFILKTSLVLINTGAKYDINKFRKEDILNSIKNNWINIKDAIKEIKDFMINNTYIKSDKALPSYNALIPLIYFRYNFEDQWQQFQKHDLSFWLLRILLSGAFSGSSDSIIDKCVELVKDSKTFPIDKINEEIINRNRTIYITPESIFNTYYGQNKIYLLFSLLYNNPNFNPIYNGNLPSEDHIFPQSILKQQKILNEETDRMVMKYDKWNRDQIANLMLLSIGENRDEKRAISPFEWFKSKDNDYLKLHLIPSDQELWKVENFENFIEQRKILIIKKLQGLNIVQRLGL